MAISKAKPRSEKRHRKQGKKNQRGRKLQIVTVPEEELKLHTGEISVGILW